MYVYHPRGCHVRMRPYRLIRDGKLLLKRDRHRDKTRAYRRLDSINYEQIGWPSTSASPAHRKETATPSGRHDSRYRMQPRPTDATPPLNSCTVQLRVQRPRERAWYQYRHHAMQTGTPRPHGAETHGQPLPIGTKSLGAGLPNHQLALARLLKSQSSPGEYRDSVRVASLVRVATFPHPPTHSSHGLCRELHARPRKATLLSFVITPATDAHPHHRFPARLHA